MKKYLSFHLGKCRCRELENGHLAIETNIKELYITEETTPFQVLLPSAEQMRKNRCLCYSTEQNGIFITLTLSGGVLLFLPTASKGGFSPIYTYTSPPYGRRNQNHLFRLRYIISKSQIGNLFSVLSTIPCQKWDFSFFVKKMSGYSLPLLFFLSFPFPSFRRS